MMNYAPAAGSNGYAPAPFTPLKPYDDRAPGSGRDFAAAGAFSLYALERMLRDITNQPQWRWRAKLCASYYDGKQLDQLKKWALQQEDLDERVINLIRPIINNVLGQEARARTDVRIEADDDAFADVAEAVSSKLKEAERETGAHQSISNAYGSMVKKGLGWVHVCKNADPGLYAYRFEDVPIDEVWWDWRGQKGTMLDDRCRWLCRMRMVDLDEVIAALPEHREVLERTAAGWDDPRLNTLTTLGEPEDIQLVSSFADETRFNSLFRKFDWVDSARRMVKLVEVWYRVPAMGVFLALSPTRRVPYNAKDPRHIEAVARGLVKIVKGPTSQVRRALYAGPHRLLDVATDRKHFPYVPFFAYRDDEDGSPYGLIDGMIAPQDDYNDRCHRIQWMLKARQLFIENDALDPAYNTIKEVADAVNRPDLVAVLNSQRLNRSQDAIKIGNTLSMQKEQFEMQDRAENNIQKAAGRYASNLGSAQVDSGIANQLLIEQGEQSMGELNDNYTHARRRSFELLVDLIVDDHKEPDLKVPVGQGKARRVIVLNTWAPPVDPATGEPVEGAPVEPQNFVAEAEIRTGLAETPNTPAYRNQTQTQLKEILTAIGTNPQATALLMPAYIESTNLSDRAEVADDLRRLSGLPPKGDRRARQKAEQQQMAAASEAQQVAKAKEQAEAQDKLASARQKNAQARKVNAEAEALERKLAAGGIETEVQQQRIGNATSVMNADPEDAEIDGAINEAMSATS